MPITVKNLWSCIYLKLFWLFACFVLFFGFGATESKAVAINFESSEGYINGTYLSDYPTWNSDIDIKYQPHITNTHFTNGTQSLISTSTYNKDFSINFATSSSITQCFDYQAYQNGSNDNKNLQIDFVSVEGSKVSIKITGDNTWHAYTNILTATSSWIYGGSFHQDGSTNTFCVASDGSFVDYYILGTVHHLTGYSLNDFYKMTFFMDNYYVGWSIMDNLTNYIYENYSELDYWLEDDEPSDYDMTTGLCAEFPCIRYPYYVQCIDNRDCYLKIKYNHFADNGEFYLSPDEYRTDGQETIITNAIANTNLTDIATGSVGTIYLDITNAYGTTTEDFLPFMGLFTTMHYMTSSGDLGENYETLPEVLISWSAYDGYFGTSSVPGNYAAPIFDACADVCADLDEGSWWSPDIICAGRKLWCWSFTPSEGYMKKFEATNNQLLKQFPISIGYQMYNIFNTLGVGSTTAVGSIHVPLKWYSTETHTYEDTGVDLLNGNTLRDGMPGDLYDWYWTWTIRLLYLLGLLYIMNRVMQLIGGGGLSLKLRGRNSGKPNFIERHYYNQAKADIRSGKLK